MNRMVEILDLAYMVAMQSIDGKVNPEMAEELAGECAELLAHIDQDEGSFGSEYDKDPELVELAEVIRNA